MLEYRYTNNLLEVRNAAIIFRNFSGEKTQYNREGDRNFSVVIDNEELAKILIEDGWNLKPLRKRDEDDDQAYHLKIKVGMRDDQLNCKIYRNIGGNEFEVTLDDISDLDRDDLMSCNMSIRPYRYDVNGRQGISAYLKTMYAMISDDVFIKG